MLPGSEGAISVPGVRQDEGHLAERRACKTVKVRPLFFGDRAQQFDVGTPRHPGQLRPSGANQQVCTQVGASVAQRSSAASARAGSTPMRLIVSNPAAVPRSILNQISPSTAPMLRMPS